MTIELNPEHQAVADEARERIKRLMNRLAIYGEPSESSSDLPVEHMDLYHD